MKVTISRIENSEGVIIPKEMLKQLGVRAGDELEIQVDQGVLHLRPVN